MHDFTDATLDQIASTTREPEALTEARRAALKRHVELESPIADVEAWKHTTLQGFALDAFTPAAERTTIEGAEAVRAVGGIVAPCAEALADSRVAASLERIAFAESEIYFTTLAAAFAAEPLVVLVPRNATIADPLVLRRSIENGRDAVFPTVLILAEENAEVTVIEHATSAGFDGAGDALAVHTTFIDAGQGSRVTYLSLQEYAQDVWHLAPTRAVIGRDATVRTFTATLGGRFTRSVTESVLEGRGGSAELLGVYFGDHDQRVDHRTLQHHIGANTTSELSYKGALKGRSQAVYAGLVAIDHDAIDADAQQKNRNLILSSGASADASPSLEILTSEVQRATHGVSVGRPDDEVLFYLESRGLSRDVAERIFVKGFFQEVIDRVPVGAVRAALEDLIEAELDLEDQP
jgi:Fe-S cluster assembly protein SufD